MREEHYDGLGPSVSSALATTAWGGHAETGLHALRLIAAGIFDQVPDLQIILGHMGEMIPFMLNRADEWLTPAARSENNLQLSVAETFRRNFWITTSGMFSSPSSCSYTKSSDPTDCSSQSTTPSAPTPKDAPSSMPSRSTPATKKNSATATPNTYYASHPFRPHHHDPDLTNDNRLEAPPTRYTRPAATSHGRCGQRARLPVDSNTEPAVRRSGPRSSRI